uniref:Uncharacterized protein n=1 Tax=Pinguiococcus pyrenoidosus TaxID=172671 RepID=A0A7R9UCY0_9STRA|mmetsp:Transcript_6013/g.23356  ORF Transcript_6013/g.23356 Transcript_6013/m.23356 type:complete len:536 (+) Transcript_6013:165-1772(+)
MPSCAKRQRRRASVPFAPGFKPPDEAGVRLAVGSFPHQLSPIADAAAAPEQLNEPALYQSRGLPGLSAPQDPQDWLATVAEEGQSFDDYVSAVTTRSNRFKTSAGAQNLAGILLVPLLERGSSWPEYAPELEQLRRYTFAFFGRGMQVAVADAVEICFKGENVPANKAIWMPQEKTGRPQRWLKVRRSGPGKLNRRQLHIDPLLASLCDLRNQDLPEKRPFCVVGVTMEDIFAANSDLFVAGMAAGRSCVAVFSLLRYHPHLRMSPLYWWKYGFASRPSMYSYFEESDAVTIRDDQSKRRRTVASDPETAKGATGGAAVGVASRAAKTGAKTASVPASDAIGRPKDGGIVLSSEPPLNSLSASSKSEALRRASKLLCHEIAHLFMLDHCIYKSCIMNGTGHLVEDFASPSFMCGIDLRKLQFRLGFDVRQRYDDLQRIWRSWGFEQEAAWCRNRSKEAREVIDCGEDRPEDRPEGRPEDGPEAQAEAPPEGGGRPAETTDVCQVDPQSLEDADTTRAKGSAAVEARRSSGRKRKR